MAEDGAPHDGQVRVGAHEVVGEELHEIQELPEGGPLDLHGGVLAVEDDAVLVVVDVGAVLEEPVLAVDGHGDHPVVLPGGMVHPACVALVLPAELALGVPALGGGLGRGDGLGVLLRLGEVDGDVQVPVRRRGDPLHVLGDAVAADVVRVLAQAVEPVRGLLRRAVIFFPEGGDDLAGPGGQLPHELGVQQVPADHAPGDDPPGLRVVQQGGQDVLQGQVLPPPPPPGRWRSATRAWSSRFTAQGLSSFPIRPFFTP